jgi:hypothetical protein
MLSNSRDNSRKSHRLKITLLRRLYEIWNIMQSYWIFSALKAKQIVMPLWFSTWGMISQDMTDNSGMFGDKEATLTRFKENYIRLSDRVKKRLVLENDDMCWCVQDLLPTCQDLGIPMVLVLPPSSISNSRIGIITTLSPVHYAKVVSQNLI